MQSYDLYGDASLNIINTIDQPLAIGSVAFTQDQIARIERQRPTDFILTAPPPNTPTLTTDLAETEKFLASISDTKDVTTEETMLPPVMATDSVIQTFTEQNPLHNYASYTYNITLAALTPEEYNEMMASPTTAYVPKHTLMASGSRRTYQRDPRFEKDFYIEDLRFETVVGLNSQTKASNVVKMNFIIKEPMGVSFFDRLLDMSRALGIDNYLQTPYLMIIEYFGHLDDGSIVPLTGHRKYIPIRIVSAKLSVKNTGSEYAIDAVPYNHSAFMSVGTGTTPANFQIPAKTVGEFFSNVGMTSVAAQVEAASEDSRELSDADIMNMQAEGKDYRQEQTRRKTSVIFSANSYPAALNAFEEYSKETLVISTPHVYKFVFDDEIANAEIINYPELPSGRIFYEDGKQSYRDPKKDSNDGKAQGMFSVKAGMSVIDVINMVVKSSSYIRDNLVKPDTASEEEIKDDTAITVEKAKPPIDWFKITPDVKIIEYDKKRNLYALEITYIVQKHLMHNTKSPLAKKSVPTEVLTNYNYIFTGDNKDILDLQIDFDVLFYILSTVGKTKWETTNDSPVADYDKKQIKNVKNNTNIAFEPATQNVSDHSSHHGNGSTETQEKIAVSDFWNSMMSSSRGDMINVRLKIIGDPRYIKQDDFYFNRLNSSMYSSAMSENNSVNYDAQERYVHLKFITPADYDENTGMLESETRYAKSGFSGVYRVIMVENNFVSGRFEQVIDMIRMFDQTPDQNQDEISNKNEERSSPVQDPRLTTADLNA